MITSQDLVFIRAISSSSSLANASLKLNVTPSSVSQRLKSLEERLNLKIIDREAKKLSLTQDGEKLALNGRKVLDSLEELYNEVIQDKNKLKGYLRVYAPIGFGQQFLAPLVSDFKNNNKQLTIELLLSDIPELPTEDPSAVMVYIGKVQNLSLRYIPLAKNRRILCASPEYIKQSTPLNSPNDLHNHQCIILRENNEDATLWQFFEKKRKEQYSLRIKPFLASNNGNVIKSWATEGYGIIQRSEWDVSLDIKEGRLVELIPDYSLPDADITAMVSTEKKKRPLKTQLFLDFLKNNLKITHPN